MIIFFILCYESIQIYAFYGLSMEKKNFGKLTLHCFVVDFNSALKPNQNTTHTVKDKVSVIVTS